MVNRYDRGPVEPYDRCRGGDQCAHCKAGCPSAPDWAKGLDRPSQSTWELEDQERASLPPALHLPSYIDTCTPSLWACTSCWTDGTLTPWPCTVALRHPNYIGELRATRVEPAAI